MRKKQGGHGTATDAGKNEPREQRSTGAGNLATLAAHPFLFAGASVVSLYASNLREVTFGDVTTALAAVLAAALVLFLVFGAILRTLGARPAILTSATLLAGLHFRYVLNLVNNLSGENLPPVGVIAIMLIGLSLLLIMAARLRANITWMNIALNAVALAVILPPAWDIMSYEWKSPGGSFFNAAQTTEGLPSESNPQVVPIGSSGPRQTPDIYYFIFDRYASQSVLAEHFDFDNSEFIEFLETKDFFVARNSYSNYLKTGHSLASTFHMDYLDFLAEDERSTSQGWHPIHALLEDHRVGRFLKDRNYDFIQIGSWWGPTQHNRYADENHSFGLSEFNYIYLRKTVVPAALDAVAPQSPYAQKLHWANAQCRRVPRQIEAVKDARGRSEPTFVFAHILVPHGPNVFDPEGRCLTWEEAVERDSKQGYLDQIEYANTLIKDAVSALLDGEGPKPIIIIQSDEGPFPERARGASWRDATEDEFEIKTGILNAYYFPDGDYSGLYHEITPVNTFRSVFNKYFGTRFQRLPDRIYGFPDHIKIYDFFEITEVVRNDDT